MGLDTAINSGMINTIDKEPEVFLYLNNGLTIVCDQARVEETGGRSAAIISNPQIINGQQTTRALASKLKDGAEKTSVLVKVIIIPRQRNEDIRRFELLVTKIVSGTNWQNRITQGDLMSNDRKQIELERKFRAKNYVYLRKRGKRDPQSKKYGFQGDFQIKKEELAQAVAGCTFDPAVVRAGVDNLFSEKSYPDVFPSSDISFYLPKFWLFRAISKQSRSEPTFGYMKWLALNFAWSIVERGLEDKASLKRRFWEECEGKNSAIHDHLAAISKAIFAACKTFYSSHKRDKEGNEQDESNFFKNRRGLPQLFSKDWKTKPYDKLRSKVGVAATKIEKLLNA